MAVIGAGMGRLGNVVDPYVGVDYLEGQLAALEELKRALDDLHAFARHRLLRQPQGFEGLRPVSVARSSWAGRRRPGAVLYRALFDPTTGRFEYRHRSRA